MRNKWFEKVGAGRVSLEKRGLLATLEALGDEVCMRKPELDALFGEGWEKTAQELRCIGMLWMEYDEGFYELKIVYRNEKRKMYIKKWTERRKSLKRTENAKRKEGAAI